MPIEWFTGFSRRAAPLSGPFPMRSPGPKRTPAASIEGFSASTFLPTRRR
jgi:hypothetical protein